MAHDHRHIITTPAEALIIITHNNSLLYTMTGVLSSLSHSYVNNIPTTALRMSNPYHIKFVSDRRK